MKRLVSIERSAGVAARACERAEYYFRQRRMTAAAARLRAAATAYREAASAADQAATLLDAGEPEAYFDDGDD